MTVPRIPRIIWQTYRTKEIPSEALECRRSWLALNPGWEYRFMDDRDIDGFARDHLAPRDYTVFRELPLGVMRADFWRYLVTRAHGGLYADLDTLCLSPIDEWLPREADLVVGPENRQHFCQWTFLSAPGHPCLDAVVGLLLERARAGVDVSAEHFVHYHSGPGVWTEGILRALGRRGRDVTALSGGVYTLPHGAASVEVLAPSFFNGGKVRHLFGSRSWRGNYARWIEERDGVVSLGE